MSELAHEHRAIAAQAHLHHGLLLGLQLMISTRRGAEVMGDWMFRLFRRQHLDKFLASFDKLGLTGLPHAVACAQYHVLSNNMGGVGVEYLPERDDKAWVRFRYPRWMYHGPTICGVPVEVSRGFLRGWYAHNGVSLRNPRLGYVCVSEDMTGQFGLCGYFREYDHELTDSERLQFAPDETPPPFDPAAQPTPPADQWNAERLQKAGRNYALDYIRNGLVTLAEVIGPDDTRALAGLAARLIGLQYYPEIATMIGARDGDVDDAARFLATMFEGMGDVAIIESDGSDRIVVQRPDSGPSIRVLRDLPDPEAELLFDCWQALWTGALHSQRRIWNLSVIRDDAMVCWRIGDSGR